MRKLACAQTAGEETAAPSRNSGIFHHSTREGEMFRTCTDHEGLTMRRVAIPALLAALTLVIFGPGPSAAATAAACARVPAPQTLEATQPLNLGELKLQVLRYACSGEHDRAIAEVLATAQAYVVQRAGEVTRPALVLDIDETSLSNWREIFANDFGYIPDGPCDALPKGPCGVHAWELGSRGAVIAPTLALFNAAKGKGVAVFFITGRFGDAAARAATERNLQDVGYDGWSGLMMQSAETRHLGAKDYKTAERAKIEAQGFTIIANVGDQRSDLEGGYSERVFRVPNPFYFIP
jgi:acid phosphatase